MCLLDGPWQAQAWANIWVERMREATFLGARASLRGNPENTSRPMCAATSCSAASVFMTLSWASSYESIPVPVSENHWFLFLYILALASLTWYTISTMCFICNRSCKKRFAFLLFFFAFHAVTLISKLSVQVTTISARISPDFHLDGSRK